MFGKRKVLYILLIVATMVSYLFLWTGLYSIITSGLIYVSIFYFFHSLLSLLLKNRFSATWRLLFLSTCLSLMILDVGLRIGTDKYQSHSERNGSFFLYYCPFTIIRLENFARSLADEDIRLYVQKKSETRIENSSEFSYAHTINSLGFRDEEPELTNIDSNFTIVGFGDSFTEGVGASQDSTWVKLLEDDLKNCKNKLLTVNAGRSGSDIIYESYKFQHLVAKKFKPKLVVFAINTTDIRDLILRGGAERFVSKDKIVYRDGPWWKYLYGFSYVWRVIAHEIIGVDWTLYSEEDRSRMERDAKDLISTTICNDIVPFAKTHNIQTLFVFTPMEYQLDEDSFGLTELSSSLQEDGINVLNLHAEFSRFSDGNTDYYWDINKHCNAQGYLLWSKAIGAEIRQQGFIDCK